MKKTFLTNARRRTLCFWYRRFKSESRGDIDVSILSKVNRIINSPLTNAYRVNNDTSVIEYYGTDKNSYFVMYVPASQHLKLLIKENNNEIIVDKRIDVRSAEIIRNNIDKKIANIIGERLSMFENVEKDIKRKKICI
jgi:hypothetical protein